MLASAWAGATAAPTATVLSASAAAMAKSERVRGDCDDISKLLFEARLLFRGPMLITIQMPCQSRKTAEKYGQPARAVVCANQDLADFANGRVGTFATRGASKRKGF
jgi:hypothetical protein